MAHRDVSIVAHTGLMRSTEKIFVCASSLPFVKWWTLPLFYGARVHCQFRGVGSFLVFYAPNFGEVEGAY